MVRIVPLLLAFLLLSGCGTMADPREWFSGSDPALEPAELSDFSPSLQPVVLWSADVGKGSVHYNRLLPAVSDGRVYTLDAEGLLQARQADSGALLWQVETGLPTSAGPGVGDGLLVVGTAEGQVVAFDAESGAERWRRELSSEVLAVPAIGQDKVVVHTADGKLFGLDAAGGEKRWVYNHKAPVLTLRGGSSPVISGSTVFCGLSGGKLVALALDSGLVEWEGHVSIPTGRSDLERMVDVDADPLVYSGTVYSVAYQGDVVALGEGSGKVFWKRKLSAYNNMAVNWQQLAVSDAQGFVWSLDPDTGSARWRVEELRNRELSAPALMGDHVVVGDLEGYLHWLSANDGSFTARLKVSGDPIIAPPVMTEEHLYVLSSDGKLTALRLPE